MPDAIITSTESTFGTISGTFAADQSTITGTVTGIVAGSLSGSVGVPGPAGVGIPAGGLEGQIIVKASDTDYDTAWADNSAETLTATVRNETGATLTKGTVVYITGAAGNKALVSKASASSEATSSKTFAILSADILNNQNGTAVTVGLLKGLDTSALTEGGSLWLSTTAGQWTQTMPTAPNHAVFLGTVTRVHANQGTVEVRIQNGYELQELHNVKITSVSNGQVLKYDSAQSLWVNGTDVGVPAGGTAGQFLQKIDGTDYNTDWVTVNLSAYAVKANNLSDLTSFSDARDNLGLGTLNTPVFAGVTAQGSGSNVANLTPTSLSLTHTTAGTFTIQPSVGITFPDSTVQTTAFTGLVATTWGSITGTLSSQTDLQTALDGKYSTSNPSGYITSSALTGYATESWVTAGFYPLTGNPSGFLTSASLTGYATESWVTSQGYITSSALSPYLLSSTAASTYQTIAGMSSYLTTSAAASTYYPLTNPSGYITSSALAGYATESWVTGQLGSYLTTSTAASTYAPIASPTFTGLSTFNNPGNYAITIDNTAGYYTSISSGVYSLFNASTEVIRLSVSGIKYPDGVTQSVAYPGPSGFLLKADNLSGLASASTARTNLGLGTMATETASNYLTTATAASTYAPLASPALTGNPTAPTPATADNDTSIATTAFVKAQGYLTSAPVTSVAGKTGAVTLVVGDVSGAAPLASPSLTGTPTAPTAAAATNTTQIATTAFVQQEVPAASTTAAGKVELATRVEVIEPTSDTLAVTPFRAIDVLMHPGYVQIAQNNNNVTTATSGAGAGIFTTSMTRVCLGPNAATAGSVTYRPQTNGGVAQMWSRGNSGAQINFSKKVWMSGRSAYDNTFIGDANNISRVTIGKSGTGAGALAQKGIGWQKAGGSTATFALLAHNGTTLTTVATSTSLSSLGLSGGATFDWSIYSDGAGNVTMWINDTQVATTSAGPTGLSLGSCVWQEEIDQTASAATRMYFTVYGGHYYHV